MEVTLADIIEADLAGNRARNKAAQYRRHADRARVQGNYWLERSFLCRAVRADREAKRLDAVGAVTV